MKTTLSAQKGLYTTEDPWIRYVDPVAGDDDNDGKTPATAWATLTKAASEMPVVSCVKVLKIAAGTLNGPCRIRAGFGLTIIVGEILDVYEDCTYVPGSFEADGTGTKEKWQQIDLDYSGQTGFALDDTLLDYYLEFNNNTGGRHRVKIYEYEDLGGNQVRLFLDGATFAQDIHATSQGIRIVRMASIISANSVPDAALRIDSMVQTFSNYNKYSSFSGSVCLFNITLENSAANGCALALCGTNEMNLGGTFIKNGTFLTSTATMSRNMTSGQDVLTSMGFGQDVAWIVEPRGATSSTPGFCIGRENTASTIAFYHPNNADYFVMSDLRPSGTLYLSEVNAGIMFMYKRAGSTYIVRSMIVFSNGTTVGQSLFIDGTYGHCTVTHSSGGNGLGFRGAPLAGFGRVTVTEGASFKHRATAGLDFGDVSTYTDSAPLLLVDKNSEARINGVLIGSSGKECIAATEMIRVKDGGRLTLSGNSTIYHGNATTKPSAITIAVEEGSELRVTKSKSITINAYTSSGAAFGVLYIENSRYIHDDEQYSPSGVLTINQNYYSSSPIIYLWSSKFICDADVNITTETFSYGVFNVSYSDVNITGDITLDGDWHAGWFYFSKVALSKFYHTLNGFAEPDALEFDHCNVDISDYRVDTFDFGAGAIVKIHRCSKMYISSVTDGDATYNRNTNASGYGIEVRDSSSLINNHARGWDGTAGDIKLGSAAGFKAYPGAGVSVTDIVDASEGVSELCMVKSLNA